MRTICHRYILKEKVLNPDGDTFVYELAEKSLDQEAVKSKLDSFIAKVNSFSVIVVFC